jgi:hypothetical protein
MVNGSVDDRMFGAMTLLAIHHLPSTDVDP